MSNFIQDFEEDDEQFHTIRLMQSSHGSPSTTENGGDSSSHPITTMASKRKRSLPGNPDPDAEVVALSPRTLMATNRYICEVCHKGFQRDQNLQLHRRGHNLPWKLKQRPANIQVKKRVYVCPVSNCVHHEPTRALGDLTGIKKHFCRKHGEKKWKCDKCSKRYAVQSDWKAHAKICGTREYRCDCGTIFSRKDSFITHRAFCDALTEENHKTNMKFGANGVVLQSTLEQSGPCTNTNIMMRPSISSHDSNNDKSLSLHFHMSDDYDLIFNKRTMRPCFSSTGEANNSSIAMAMAAYTSATALLQKAAEMGAKVSDNTINPILFREFSGYSASTFNSPMDNCNNINASGLHAINSESFGKNMVAVTSTTTHSGLYDSSLVMRSSKRQVFLGGSEKLTVDFLGVDTGGKRDYYDGNMVTGLPYSHVHQTRLRHQQSDW